MKRSAIFINTARGSIVNQDELYNALVNKQIAGAAIDVTDPEPINSDSLLLGLNNLVIAPHIGSASYKTRKKMADMAIENLIAGLKGQELPYRVDAIIQKPGFFVDIL